MLLQARSVEVTQSCCLILQKFLCSLLEWHLLCVPVFVRLLFLLHGVFDPHVLLVQQSDHVVSLLCHVIDVVHEIVEVPLHVSRAPARVPCRLPLEVFEVLPRFCDGGVRELSPRAWPPSEDPRVICIGLLICFSCFLCSQEHSVLLLQPLAPRGERSQLHLQTPGRLSQSLCRSSFLPEFHLRVAELCLDSRLAVPLRFQLLRLAFDHSVRVQRVLRTEFVERIELMSLRDVLFVFLFEFLLEALQSLILL
mmetsp:Transcript_37074/g.72929  ORF Transcript_37074/g.72929 Transcript_37074/m.72929 type:complete len:252 (+) Transcript_37074:788-1543(+)